ncbi:glycine cleavage system protein H, partial [Nonomuraea sp. NPDC049637]
MSNIPDDLNYTKEHEWVSGVDDGITVTVGITAFAAEALGDVVFVQLPEVGSTVEAGDSVGEVESTKSVSEI